MADEITVTGLLTFLKSPSAQIAVGETALNFDVDGSKYVTGVQEAGTSAEALELGDIGTPGWFYMKNLDDTNYMEVLSAVAGEVLLKLEPGEFALGRFGCAAPAVKADTAAVEFEFTVVEA